MTTECIVCGRTNDGSFMRRICSMSCLLVLRWRRRHGHGINGTGTYGTE